jgi:hypothetical protein
MLANASIQNTTTLQGLLCAAFNGFPALSHGWIPPLFAGMTHGRRGIVASIEKAEQHLAGGLDVVTDALAHRDAVARDEAFQHEVVLCIRRVVIA